MEESTKNALADRYKELCSIPDTHEMVLKKSQSKKIMNIRFLVVKDTQNYTQQIINAAWRSQYPLFKTMQPVEFSDAYKPSNKFFSQTLLIELYKESVKC